MSERNCSAISSATRCFSTGLSIRCGKVNPARGSIEGSQAPDPVLEAASTAVVPTQGVRAACAEQRCLVASHPCARGREHARGVRRRRGPRQHHPGPLGVPVRGRRGARPADRAGREDVGGDGPGARPPGPGRRVESGPGPGLESSPWRLESGPGRLARHPDHRARDLRGRHPPPGREPVMRVAELDDVTYDLEVDGEEVRRTLHRRVWERGAWATVAIVYEERGPEGTWRPAKLALI